MKKIYFVLAAFLFAFASCNVAEEWGPVFTEDEYPEEYPQLIMNRTITIADLCAKYENGKPWKMTGNHIIEGRVISSDQEGNFYKSFYIQDETAGIEIKIGKNGLYNDYKEGQTIYVKCNDLYLGMYGGKGTSSQGMVQIGHKDPMYYVDPKLGYETSYMEAPLLIDTHVIRGEINEPVKPVVLSESELPTAAQHQAHNKNVGRLVTLNNLSYSWVDPKYKELNTAFALLYPDPNRSHTSDDPENRLFLSTDGLNITTWAMSKAKVVEHLKAGDWDAAEIGSGNTKFGPITNVVSESGMFAKDLAEYREQYGEDLLYKDLLIKNAAAASVSQYFKTEGGTCIQIRTSGFCKFCDKEIPADILNGKKNINVTGVICMYQGSIQMMVNRLEDITYADGTPLYK